jgi:hypothetical protein
MSINWQSWAKLSPTNKTYVMLFIVASTFMTAWLVDSRKTIATLRDSNNDCGKALKQLSKEVSDCERENARIMREANEEQVRYERERARRADSIAMALMAAEKAVKKAIK